MAHRSGRPPLHVDVVVPSYRRPAGLRQCLEGLSRQTLAPQRVVVVLRPDDTDSQAVAQRAPIPQLHIATVHREGGVAAIAEGFAHTSSGFVAITDDDAVPHPDWLERLVSHAGREGIGAVGGRDIVTGGSGRPTMDVGRLLWWGGLVGNHHLGVGGVRQVDVLKGVNVMFRAEAVALPAPGVLRGRGAEPHWEVLVCSHLRRRGLVLLYDPRALVDHHPGPIIDYDHRSSSPDLVADAAHNLFLGTAGPRPAVRPIHYVGGILRGDRAAPGLVRSVVGLARREPRVGEALLAAIRGRTAAYRRLGMTGTPPMIPAAPARTAATKG